MEKRPINELIADIKASDKIPVISILKNTVEPFVEEIQRQNIISVKKYGFETYPLYMMYFFCYNYGYIMGQRAERARRKRGVHNG